MIAINMNLIFIVWLIDVMFINSFDSILRTFDANFSAF